MLDTLIMNFMLNSGYFLYVCVRLVVRNWSHIKRLAMLSSLHEWCSDIAQYSEYSDAFYTLRS